MENLSVEILIKDPAHVAGVKALWKTIPDSSFHVLADFDRTLTQGIVEGHRSPSVIAQIRNGDYLSPEYVEKAHALFNTYHPIEINDSVPREDRLDAMHTWWKSHFDLLSESGLNKALIDRVVKERPLVFREGTRDLIDMLEEAHIPLVILSAAPGDMIVEYLKSENISVPRNQIMANWYRFDENGTAVELLEPIVHSLNKHDILLEENPKTAEIHARPHVLLLGDGVGDIGMIEGFPYESVLKVGFLNLDVETRKQAFLDAFDIVITHDGPMTPIVDLIKETILS